ncbi:hypothetical protein QTG54_005316 [Skeletonema marinoi]|uniref:Uncharacterized protein n=1 Tax=Skeletonema marinoi TaxID=267567 RepID=A0AAD8YDR0_9STRA|nr:hypothetical protein QTG54_005316 [Skeletonema marinoi]
MICFRRAIIAAAIPCIDRTAAFAPFLSLPGGVSSFHRSLDQLRPHKMSTTDTDDGNSIWETEGTMVRMTCFRVVPREAEIELESLVQPSEEVEELAWIDSTFDMEKLTVTGIMIVEDLKEKGLID